MKWCWVIKAAALEQLYHLAVHQWHHFLLRTLFGHWSLLSRTSWSPVVLGGTEKEQPQKNLKTLSDLNMDSCYFHWVSQCCFWISEPWITLLGLFVQVTSIVTLISLATEHSFKPQIILIFSTENKTEIIYNYSVQMDFEGVTWWFNFVISLLKQFIQLWSPSSQPETSEQKGQPSCTY